MKRIPAIFLLVCGALVAGAPALAQGSGSIWSCRDKEGKTHVTNIREDTQGMDCRVVEERVTIVPAGPSSASTASSAPRAKAAQPPAGFPRETPATRASAKDKQRQILEQELEQERALLERSRKALAEQEAVRYGDERNYARVLARLKPYQDTVELHQKNVEALERELALLDK
ncbi:MAG: hypothetical protein R3357_01265 [Burkholderiales bacterium]|nr:hypothetical protein [Burkholderiales bacterium]